MIEGIKRVKDLNSYPVDKIAQLAGAAAIQDKEYFETVRNKIIETREKQKHFQRNGAYCNRFKGEFPFC